MNDFNIHAPAKALDDLRRDDGSPDVQARRTALDEVADSLSYDEIRRLRTRLNAIMFNRDIFMDLPEELFSHVTEYLELEDLVKAQHISRAWREKFTSPDFSMGLVKKHFRTRWALSDLSDPATKTSLTNWLPKAARQRLRRQRGQFLSQATYHFRRGNAPLVARRRLEPRYESGRVAYRFVDRIVVQSLDRGHLAKPKVYMDKNRTNMSGDWLLADDLLITQNSYLGKLQAWSLRSDDFNEVRLPNNTKYISARHKQVGVITMYDEVLLWNVGRSLTSIGFEQSDVRKLEGLCWSPKAMIFHPVNIGHFFIFYHEFYHDGGATGVLVQEFAAGKYHATYQIDLGKFESEKGETTRYTLETPKVEDGDNGENGFCTIGWGPQLHSDIQVPSDIRTFNMYTCEFGSMPRPPPYPTTILRKEERGMRNQDVEVRRSEGDLSSERPFAARKLAYTVYDDNFAIMFREFEYTVWCFDEDIKLPLTDSQSDESPEQAWLSPPLPRAPQKRVQK